MLFILGELIRFSQQIENAPQPLEFILSEVAEPRHPVTAAPMNSQFLISSTDRDTIAIITGDVQRFEQRDGINDITGFVQQVAGLGSDNRQFVSRLTGRKARQERDKKREALHRFAFCERGNALPLQRRRAENAHLQIANGLRSTFGQKIRHGAKYADL